MASMGLPFVVSRKTLVASFCTLSSFSRLNCCETQTIVNNAKYHTMTQQKQMMLFGSLCSHGLLHVFAIIDTDRNYVQLIIFSSHNVFDIVLFFRLNQPKPLTFGTFSLNSVECEHMHARTHTRTHARIRAHTQTNTHTHTHTSTHTRTNARTHARMHSPSQTSHFWYIFS